MKGLWRFTEEALTWVKGRWNGEGTFWMVIYGGGNFDGKFPSAKLAHARALSETHITGINHRVYKTTMKREKQ